MTQTETTVTELCELWGMLFLQAAVPSFQQWGIWLLRYDHRTVRQGIANLALKYSKIDVMDAEYMQKFASSAMASIHNQTTARLGAQWHNRTTGAL